MVLIASLRPPRPSPVGERVRRIEVRPLNWETDFFEERMGALVLTEERSYGPLNAQADTLSDELRSALREAELEGLRHLTMRVRAEDLPAIWAAERCGLRLMDVAVDLKFAFASTPLPPRGDRPVRLGRPDDIAAMRSMTVGAFGLTRFGVDPFFTQPQVDAFYATWATNLFAGLADAVLVAELDGQPAGFVSTKLGAGGSGRIPLVATATQFQRRGVARDLVAAALAWFAEAGCSVGFVKTQAANYPAVALYERAGFIVSQSELTFTTTLN
jgi:dTDP-4-amino-4,6-dideoxy-D-galactose acyltransferase